MILCLLFCNSYCKICKYTVFFVAVNSEDVIKFDFIGHKVIRDDIPIDHGLSQAVFCKGDGDQPSQRDSWQCVTGASWTEMHMSGATHVCVDEVLRKAL